MLLNNEPQTKKEEDLSFTQKCILISILAKDNSKILITSFYDLPLVKLYTSEINTKNLIYTKIKGVLCFLQNKTKDPNSNKYFFQIYSLDNYSLLFNAELNKQDLQHYIKVRDFLYCLETKEYLIAFKFRSKQNAEKFYTQVRGEPNKDTLTQNEKAYNIDSSKLNNNIYKDIIDSIKEEFLKNNKKKDIKSSSSKFNTNTKNNESTKIIVNDCEDDYLDFSNIYYLYVLMNNTEFDVEDNMLDIFESKKIDKNACQNIINQFNKNNLPNFPMQIIDKDYNNILNKRKYINFMTNNIMETIRQKTVLFKLKNENRQKQNQEQKDGGEQYESSRRKLSIATRKVNSNLKNTDSKVKNRSVEKRKVLFTNSVIKKNSINFRDVNKKGNANKNANFNKSFKGSENNKDNLKNSKTIKFENKSMSAIKQKGYETNPKEKKKGMSSAFNIGGIFKKKKKE